MAGNRNWRGVKVSGNVQYTTKSAKNVKCFTDINQLLSDTWI